MVGPCEMTRDERKTFHSENAQELNRRIKLSFDDKCDLSETEIVNALGQTPWKDVIISSSFGKDSMVLSHMVKMIDSRIRILHIDTGQQYKETDLYRIAMCEKYGWNPIIVKPKYTFMQIADKYRQFPLATRTKESGRKPKCCYHLKMSPVNNYIRKNNVLCNFIGEQATESYGRRLPFIFKGSATYYAKHDGYIKSKPLTWFTDKEIWEYHDVYDIPKNPAYEKYNINRTGCYACTGYKTWESDMKRNHPKLYEHIQNKKIQYEYLNGFDWYKWN